jgi:hypothetical protein
MLRKLSKERVPADPERAERNRETVRDLVRRRDPVLAKALDLELPVLAERPRAARAARARSAR